jgi:hypothetical protein
MANWSNVNAIWDFWYPKYTGLVSTSFLPYIIWE